MDNLLDRTYAAWPQIHGALDFVSRDASSEEVDKSLLQRLFVEVLAILRRNGMQALTRLT